MNSSESSLSLDRGFMEGVNGTLYSELVLYDS